jgi:hypothetical protein
MVVNVLSSPYSKYFKPNSKVYDTLDGGVVGVNPLTGQPASTTSFSKPPTTTLNYFTCILEFRIREGKVSEKPGINSGDVILQGRYYNHYDRFGTPVVGDNYSPPPWYKPGGRYILESEYLGNGLVYPLEQISSFHNAEKYFGYPLLMKFVRYEPK